MFYPLETPPLSLAVNYDTYQDISFGGTNREVMDVFIPTDAGSPTSIVVDFHGGGFYQGDKSSRWSSDLIEDLLQANIAFATCNYEFVEQYNEPDGLAKCLASAAKAVQFLKFHADFFNLNKTYFGLRGSSAGAGLSQMIAYNNNLADLSNPNPLFHEKTNDIRSISLVNPQATYDYVKWQSEIFERTDGYNIEEQYYGYPGLKAAVDRSYGISDFKEIYTDEGIAIRSKLDILDFIGKFASSVETKILNNKGFDDTLVNGLLVDAEHNVRHVEEIEKALTAKGLTSVINCSTLGFNDSETDAEFFIRTLAQI